MKRLLQPLLGLLFLSSFSALAGPVDINSAAAETLANELSGIGSVKAQLIVAYRERNGPFKTIEDLALVKGIGEKTVEANRDNILLNSKQ